jgi:hypothetical protein
MMQMSDKGLMMLMCRAALAHGCGILGEGRFLEHDDYAA